MIDDVAKYVGKLIDKFKRIIYGKTFFCPVCHLEISYADTDENGNLVCPVCGVLIELESTYGHSVPVVNDLEIKRYQPKSRLHPMATHLPIGLFPFAMMGAGFLLAVSIVRKLIQVYNLGSADILNTPFFAFMVHIEKAVLLFLVVAVAGSVIAGITGVIDWVLRYGKRPYRQIQLKIALSVVFFIFGIAVIGLQISGMVFHQTTGLIMFSSVINVLLMVVYFSLLGIQMAAMATLGHIGGYLVFGK